MSELEERSEGNSADKWERDVLERLLNSTLVEQRRARRWGIFFKSMIIGYLALVTWLALSSDARIGRAGTGLHTALIDVSGVIMEGTEASADNIIDGLRSAAKDENTKGIILRMNTPGGSPVQSAYVFDEIRRLKQEKPELPIYAVIVDLCASGGYYIAASTDKIFVNGSSIIGSIGVVMNGFGFVDAMGKLGVERRLLTAGQHKALLDPFSPVSEPEKDHIQSLLNKVHEQFIAAVKLGRGARLKESPDLFSGLVWTGDEGIKLGLADDFGDVRSVAKNIIGAEELLDFTPRERILDRISHKLGTQMEHAVQNALGMFPMIR